MKTQSDEQEAAREAGSRYGTMAADLSLIHISTATTEERCRSTLPTWPVTSVSRRQSGPETALERILQLCGRMPPSKQLRRAWKPMESLKGPEITVDDPAATCSQPVGGYRRAIFEATSRALNQEVVNGSRARVSW